MVPVLDVFQLSVGLRFHTSRVLWKMLRLTLFREGPSCKVMCSLSHGARNIPRYFHTTTRWVLQVRNIFEYTLVQRPSNPVGNLKRVGWVGLGWGVLLDPPIKGFEPVLQGSRSSKIASFEGSGYLG